MYNRKFWRGVKCLDVKLFANYQYVARYKCFNMLHLNGSRLEMDRFVEVYLTIYTDELIDLL